MKEKIQISNLFLRVLRFYPEIIPKKNPDCLTLTESQKIKNILDSVYKPPTYDESIKKYTEHLCDIQNKSEFRSIFYHGQLLDLRSIIVKNEKTERQIQLTFLGFLITVFLIIAFLKIWEVWYIKHNGHYFKYIQMRIQLKYHEFLTKWRGKKYAQNLAYLLNKDYSQYYQFFRFRKQFLKTVVVFADQMEAPSHQACAKLIDTSFEIIKRQKIEFDPIIPVCLIKLSYLLDKLKMKIDQAKFEILWKKIEETETYHDQTLLLYFAITRILIQSNWNLNLREKQYLKNLQSNLKKKKSNSKILVDSLYALGNENFDFKINSSMDVLIDKNIQKLIGDF